jgi:hypothetical protein
MSASILKTLGLAESVSGTYLGQGEWSKTVDAGVLEPINPTTGEVLGRVHASSQADYELIIQRAQAAFKVWRTTPAPAVVKPSACVRMRCAPTRTRWVRSWRWKWASPSRKAMVKCRK